MLRDLTRPNVGTRGILAEWPEILKALHLLFKLESQVAGEPRVLIVSSNLVWKRIKPNRRRKLPHALLLP
jgi:hypothetical protein